MTYLRMRVQNMRQRATALRTVAGTRNRNHKDGLARRQTLAAVRQNRATTEPLHCDSEFRLQWNTHAVAGILRTSYPVKTRERISLTHALRIFVQPCIS